MKKALLILGDGSVVNLRGRFVVLSETAGDTLSVVDFYRNGKPDSAGIICCNLPTACATIREYEWKDQATPPGEDEP